jgi:enterochelin esterase-like enzyme
MTAAASLPAQTADKKDATGQKEKSKKPAQREISWVNPKLPAGPGLTHHILDSKSMGHPVGYVVWTPRSYSEDSDRRYPVIYFLHGIGGNEAADSAGFSGWVAKAIGEKILPPVLCVFPNGGRSGYRGTVESMIVDELIPQIDKDYRTIAKPESRAVAGFSMGGAGAVYLSIRHPETFCAAGSLGGSMRAGSDEVKSALNQALVTWKQRNFGLFVVNGDKDRPEAFEELAKQMDEAGVACERVVLPDTAHNLGHYYERSAEKMLRFLSKHIQK